MQWLGSAIKLNKTFQDTFINVLDAKINNLKDIIVNETGTDDKNKHIKAKI